MLPSVFYKTSIPPKLDKDSSIKRKLYSNNLYGHRCKNPQYNIAKLNEQNKKFNTLRVHLWNARLAQYSYIIQGNPQY